MIRYGLFVCVISLVICIAREVDIEMIYSNFQIDYFSDIRKHYFTN